MKNIYIFSSVGFPSLKDVNSGIFSFEQAKAIRKNKVFLFDLANNNTNKIFLDNYDGLRIYRLFNTKFNILKIINNIRFINGIIKKNNPNLIISSFLNVKNVIYTFYINTKKVVLIHGSDANTRGFIRKIVFNFYLRRLDKIICVSNYTKKIFLRNFKKVKSKALVIHNGFSRDKLNRIDTRFKKKIQNNKKILILSVANLVPRKNLNDLIKIFYDINLKMKNKFHLNIVGQGSEKKKLIGLIEKYKLKKNVNIYSNLRDNQIASFYDVSKFFFLFSKNYGHEFEGFGIVFLEAMYKKNLIFSSQNGGITDILTNNKNAFTFDVEKSNYKKKVLSVFNSIMKNNKKRKKIIKNAFTYSKNFSWKKNIDLIINSI